MDSSLLAKIEGKYIKNDPMSFRVGDTVKVHNLIREGEKSRVQIFQGMVIAKKGSGARETFTVRKISDGVGVEKIFPIHSPNVEKIEVTKTGKVRRAKLYYLRDRVGKAALKVKQTSRAIGEARPADVVAAEIAEKIGIVEDVVEEEVVTDAVEPTEVAETVETVEAVETESKPEEVKAS